MEYVKYAKLTRSDYGGYCIVTLLDAAAIIRDEIEELAVETVLEIEIVSMTEGEFGALPAFEGW